MKIYKTQTLFLQSGIKSKSSIFIENIRIRSNFVAVIFWVVYSFLLDNFFYRRGDIKVTLHSDILAFTVQATQHCSICVLRKKNWVCVLLKKVLMQPFQKKNKNTARRSFRIIVYLLRHKHNIFFSFSLQFLPPQFRI